MNILLVEDSPTQAEEMRRMITSVSNCETWSVKSVSKLSDAQRELTKKHYDAVVMDLTLEDASPQKVIDTLPDISAICPVIVWSSNDDLQLLRTCLDHGACRVLEKDKTDQKEVELGIYAAVKLNQTKSLSESM